MWDFEIDSDALKDEINVPFFEDATGDTAPNYRTRRTVLEAQGELSRWVGKHGGIVTGIIPVKFNSDRGIRYGYIVEFMFQGGARGRIHVAALPMRTESSPKKEQVLAQALLNRAEFFKAAFTSRIHDPYSNPLLQYLLVDGEHTVAQMIVEKKKLLLLGSGVKPNTD